ncbi:MAG: glycerol-3-phosphate 1-O-acyltransferase PlsY [Chloroherpetonaceae bacterium]|nr:glycerol-3-phosphate 1-O-acyltransferase PlsY [Chloroherpetonaceae bacterium]MCS7211278.1 glycerol-3-phosphate 1-O-acyltransferase PlsY [Chloroherpetonaceae bacterium]MDW8019698.1 glycerol-3-phosphate 1-O-acyltransferase PlsY [Chloroherpetonaceae bacterium]MDW8465220.1 glycerol-3-phosphate 1-O-acyltransferase PlsY [Chloroherpetonaceae bacterium]
MLSIAVILLVSYLIGSIPTSIIVSKWVKGIDIRDYGSGNAGGTNAFRVLGWKAGLFVTLVDMLKGVAVVLWVVGFFTYNQLDKLPEMNKVVLQLLAGTAAIIGHVYTIFADFRGGKGVSTAAGIMFGIAPVTMAITLALFFAVMIVSRYVSLASMLAALSFPLIVALRKHIVGADGIDYEIQLFGSSHLIHDSLDTTLIVIGSFIALGIIYTHRSNIQRLRLGTENRVNLFNRTRS